MSRYSICKAADERGINHSTAMLIWEATQDPDEFISALDDYVKGYGFSLID